jgi:glycosyltransferase involved in cell wall biosynthesis
MGGVPVPATLDGSVSRRAGEKEQVGPVLLVTPWYRPSVGGIVESVDMLHRLLTEAGVETLVLVVEEEGIGFRLRSHPSAENVWQLQIPSYPFYSRSLKAFPAMLRRAAGVILQLRRLLKSNKIRTVILNYPSGYSWAFLLARYFWGVKLITAYLGNDITKYEEQVPAMKWLTRRLLSNSNAITVCGRHMVDMAQKLVPAIKLPMYLFPNCVDVHRFVPPGPDYRRKDTRPTILHVSIFAPKKRTLDIIEAFAIAGLPPQTRLVMVGDGHDLPAAKERARSLGLGERVEFVGKQSDVRPFFWEADLFVLASDDEGAPLVLVESMACGVPWVSTPWGVAAELPQEHCGITVPCRSPSALADALSQLMNDTEGRKAMGRRGREIAEQDLSGEAHRRRYIELIRAVEAGESPRPS